MIPYGGRLAILITFQFYKNKTLRAMLKIKWQYSVKEWFKDVGILIAFALLPTYYKYLKSR